MDLISRLVDFGFHWGDLQTFAAQAGPWVYALLFAVVFSGTGIVLAPFVPGNSMLFLAGALAAAGILKIWILLPTLAVAAVLGGHANYWVGRWFGIKVLHWGQGTPRYFNKRAYNKTHVLFEQYGGVILVLARFTPLVRTFAPFVAGIGRMGYIRYAAYDLIGGLAWTSAITLLGYWFGHLPGMVSSG